MVESVISVPEGKENELVMPKRLLHALLLSHFYLPLYVSINPCWLLFREIKDVRIDGDSVIVIYEEEG